MKFKENKEYDYNDLEMIIADNGWYEEGLGNFGIGENFIVIKDDYGNVASFMFTGYNSNHGGSYKCVYTDTKLIPNK